MRIKNIIKKVQSLDTDVLSFMPMLISLPIIGILIFLTNGKYSGAASEQILFIMCLFLWGSMGLPWVIRKEAPAFHSKGWLAVMRGLLILIPSWTIALLLIINLIR